MCLTRLPTPQRDSGSFDERVACRVAWAMQATRLRELRIRNVLPYLEDAARAAVRALESRVYGVGMTTLASPLRLDGPDFDIDRVTLLARGASLRLAHLSDTELLNRTQELVGKSGQILAALLEHLSEVDARGLYRERACSSLYTYCVYELRLSEDAAARRSSAAKLVRRFPTILEAVACGEIHLTGLLLLGPHLTDENYVGLLSLAKFRTKREISKLVRRVAPLPLVPDRVEPLGPSKTSSLDPSWTAFVESLCPPVRELPGRQSSASKERDEIVAVDAISPTATERNDEAGRLGEKIAAPARWMFDGASSGRADDAVAVSAERRDEAGRLGEEIAAPVRWMFDGASSERADDAVAVSAERRDEAVGSVRKSPRRCG